MTIWIIEWSTESADYGIDGYWTEKPTMEQVDKYMRSKFPHEFQDDYCFIYWELVSLEKESSID